MLAYCEHISVKYESKFYHSHPRKCNWKCPLPNMRPFFRGEDELRTASTGEAVERFTMGSVFAAQWSFIVSISQAENSMSFRCLFHQDNVDLIPYCCHQSSWATDAQVVIIMEMCHAEHIPKDVRTLWLECVCLCFISWLIFPFMSQYSIGFLYWQCGYCVNNPTQNK